MLLYVLRHADAEPSASSDAARRLTKVGEEQAHRVAAFCERHRLEPGLVLTSPYLRAAGTARAVAEKTSTELVEVPWLASGMAPTPALEELQAYREQPALMLVGHEPDLSVLIATLIALAGPAHLPVRKASLTCLEIHRLRSGGAQLVFTLPCRLM